MSAKSSSTSALTLSNGSSDRKRRSNVATQRSGTQGVCAAGPVWPPAIALRFSVALLADTGTTGRVVRRAVRPGTRRSRIASSTTVIWSMAFTPRNGMLPWAVRPVVTRSNQ